MRGIGISFFKPNFQPGHSELVSEPAKEYNFFMAEDLSGILQPTPLEDSRRIFSISPKLSHEWITEHTKVKSRRDFNEKITNDIIANAMEVEPGVVWPEIINLARYDNNDRRIYRGRLALNLRFSRAIGTTAYSMGWDMSSPQVVYMSICSLVIPVSERLDILNKDIHAIETGEHSFSTDEQRQQRLDTIVQEAGRLGAFNKRLRETAEKYADDFLPKDPVYRDVLRRIIHTGHVSSSSERTVALHRLKRGDAAGALEKLSEMKFRKFDL